MSELIHFTVNNMTREERHELAEAIRNKTVETIIVDIYLGGLNFDNSVIIKKIEEENEKIKRPGVVSFGEILDKSNDIRKAPLVRYFRVEMKHAGFYTVGLRAENVNSQLRAQAEIFPLENLVDLIDSNAKMIFSFRSLGNPNTDDFMIITLDAILL